MEKGGEKRRKEGKKIHFIIPNLQVFPPGYPDDGELTSLWPNGENTVARQNKHASTRWCLLGYRRKVTTKFRRIGTMA